MNTTSPSISALGVLPFYESRRITPKEVSRLVADSRTAIGESPAHHRQSLSQFLVGVIANCFRKGGIGVGCEHRSQPIDPGLPQDHHDRVGHKRGPGLIGRGLIKAPRQFGNCWGGISAKNFEPPKTVTNTQRPLVKRELLAA